MEMETVLRTPADGVVKAVGCVKGEWWKSWWISKRTPRSPSIFG